MDGIRDKLDDLNSEVNRLGSGLGALHLLAWEHDHNLADAISVFESEAERIGQSVRQLLSDYIDSQKR
jgi:hypothetical protein